MLPRIEWAAWWGDTVDRWKTEGLDPSFNVEQTLDYFNMDNLICIGVTPDHPYSSKHGGSVVTCEEDYRKIRETAYSDAVIERFIESVKPLLPKYEKGDFPLRVWLDGFFWYPRKLFGIEPHLFAFYDYPELMHAINEDLTDFNIRAVNALYEIMTPDIIGIAEDMSYNHGPMLSHDLFTEFIAPYYTRLSKVIKQRDTKLMIDSDGNITDMIPWMMDAGIEGVYPLERQANVDIVQIRAKYPRFLMMGGYDKMVMPLGEAAMKAEFERIMPVVRSGGYIMSVDHQTPPGVSLDNYRIYSRLYNEYAIKM
jgi:uroporphyrinogen-III decarboxylase